MTPPTKNPNDNPTLENTVKELQNQIQEQRASHKEELNALTTKFNEQLSQLNTALGNLNQPKSDELSFEDDNYDGDDWLDKFKAAPDKEIDKVVNPKLQATEKKIEDKITNKLEFSRAADKYDDLAYRHFPQLKETDHPLRKETEKILNEYGDSFGSRPSAIYDAARMAYANLVASGAIVPDSFKEEAIRLIQMRDAETYPFNNSSNKKSDELTKSQLAFANRLGVPEDKYKARLKKMGEKLPDRE